MYRPICPFSLKEWSDFTESNSFTIDGGLIDKDPNKQRAFVDLVKAEVERLSPSFSLLFFVELYRKAQGEWLYWPHFHIVARTSKSNTQELTSVIAALHRKVDVEFKPLNWKGEAVEYYTKQSKAKAKLGTTIADRWDSPSPVTVEQAMDLGKPDSPKGDRAKDKGQAIKANYSKAYRQKRLLSPRTPRYVIPWAYYRSLRLAPSIDTKAPVMQNNRPP